MSEILLKAKGVYKAYQKGNSTISVLANADLEVRRGDAVSVIGASGAGKSTLLHLLGSLDAPDKGDIYYRDVLLSSMTSAAQADFRNKELGFVFQFHHLLGEFSALENVMMPALIARKPRAEAIDLAERALESVALSHRKTHIPGELSGGEQQRVALARALVLDPPLVLADEVTGNLDAVTGEEIHDLLLKINEERGVTLVVVTHNKSLADRMPRRLILREGLLEERQ